MSQSGSRSEETSSVPEDVQVRRATESDIASFLDLLEAVAAEGRWIATESPVERELRAKRIQATLARDDSAVFVAVAGDALIGQLGMYTQWLGLYELGMLVEATWRGKGIGSPPPEGANAGGRSGGAPQGR